jgi:ABC-type bacteriocin/lantibiotic exporter with double-glycine peptidase domain
MLTRIRRVLQKMPALLCFVFGLAAATTATAQSVKDTYCGARCLSTSLSLVGIDFDFIEVANKVGRASNGAGVSFRELAHFLEERNVPHLLLDVSNDETVLAEIPIIVLILADGSELGHFVVLSPESDQTNAIVLDGVGGKRMLSMRTLNSGRSTHMLAVGADLESLGKVTLIPQSVGGFIDLVTTGAAYLTPFALLSTAFLGLFWLRRGSMQRSVHSQTD